MAFNNITVGPIGGEQQEFVILPHIQDRCEFLKNVPHESRIPNACPKAFELLLLYLEEHGGEIDLEKFGCYQETFVQLWILAGQLGLFNLQNRATNELREIYLDILEGEMDLQDEPRIWELMENRAPPILETIMVYFYGGLRWQPSALTTFPGRIQNRIASHRRRIFLAQFDNIRGPSPELYFLEPRIEEFERLQVLPPGATSPDPVRETTTAAIETRISLERQNRTDSDNITIDRSEYEELLKKASVTNTAPSPVNNNTVTENPNAPPLHPGHFAFVPGQERRPEWDMHSVDSDHPAMRSAFNGRNRPFPASRQLPSTLTWQKPKPPPVPVPPRKPVPLRQPGPPPFELPVSDEELARSLADMQLREETDRRFAERLQTEEDSRQPEKQVVHNVDAPEDIFDDGLREYPSSPGEIRRPELQPRPEWREASVELDPRPSGFEVIREEPKPDRYDDSWSTYVNEPNSPPDRTKRPQRGGAVLAGTGQARKLQKKEQPHRPPSRPSSLGRFASGVKDAYNNLRGKGSDSGSTRKRPAADRESGTPVIIHEHHHHYYGVPPNQTAAVPEQPQLRISQGDVPPIPQIHHRFQTSETAMAAYAQGQRPMSDPMPGTGIRPEIATLLTTHPFYAGKSSEPDRDERTHRRSKYSLEAEQMRRDLAHRMGHHADDWVHNQEAEERRDEHLGRHRRHGHGHGGHKHVEETLDVKVKYTKKVTETRRK